MTRSLVILCGLLLGGERVPPPAALEPQGSRGATVENVSFSSGPIKIAGSLLLPPGEGPFPGVVLVHGSGTSDRSNPWTSAYAEALVAQGIAVLHPDKRGSGESEGNWRTASFLDLAGDAAAGVNLLRRHAKVDGDNVGLMGFSQGGHVVPAAAAKAEGVAFAVSISGSTVPILEQIEDEIVIMAEQENLSDEEISMVRQINELGLAFAISSQGWERYESALRQARSGALAGKRVVEGFPSAADSPAWGFLRAIGNFDPMTYWERLDVPVAFVYGGRDTQVRVAKSVQRIQQRLDPKKSNYALLVFSGNGHTLIREDQIAFLAEWISTKGAI